jgi:hypothetical protein
MAKTLSESAAEILKASMSSAGKEPMNAGAPFKDLGGATPTNDYSTATQSGQNDEDESITVATERDVQVADHPEPGVAPQEPMQSMSDEPEEAIDSEEKMMDDNDAEQDDDDDEEGDDEEEMKNKMKKEMVEKYRGSMREDVDALFNGESLSEDFRVKATLIFESAVQSRVEQIVEDVLNENDTILEAAIEEIKEEMANQVDEYLNYVVEEWVGENEVAIETGLRAELSENFIAGLKTLFEEHYVEIPEEKIDIADELAAQVAELEEAVVAFAEENQILAEEVNSGKKAKAIARVCEGLTALQSEKMKSLAEGVEFTADGDFDDKLAVLRENYFPSKTNVTSEVKKAIQESSTFEQQPEVAQITDANIARYVKAITKTAPKA